MSHFRIADDAYDGWAARLRDSSIAVALGFFIIFLIASLMNFIWVGYGAFFARKVVPELMG